MSQYQANGGISGVFNVPRGVYVVGIAAFVANGVANGSIQVNTGTPVPIPTSGNTSLTPPMGTLIGPATITFLNTAGFGVELVE